MVAAAAAGSGVVALGSVWSPFSPRMLLDTSVVLSLFLCSRAGCKFDPPVPSCSAPATPSLVADGPDDGCALSRARISGDKVL